jgi:cell division protein FtsA
VLVGEFIKGENYPKIVGVGESPTMGLRHGYVVSFDDAVLSVKKAISMAEKTSDIKINRAFVSVGGSTLNGNVVSGSAIISKADSEVTQLDINKALEDCENNLSLGNKKIVYSTPVFYKLDGKDVYGRVEGMHGNKLEIKANFVTCSKPHWEDLLAVVEEAGVEVIDFVASPVASSNIALTKKHKIVGSALIDIGSETTSIAVYENEVLTSLQTFSIGAGDITNDIALGLKVTLEEAESIKLGNSSLEFSQKKVNEIIKARLSDIFELVENHLKKIKRNELLPAGIVFVGGGANTANLAELSKNFLKLTSKIGTTDMFGMTKTKLKDPAWFTALGLLNTSKGESYGKDTALKNFFKDVKNTLKSSLKQLMP